jgi:hypothetical protein
MSAATYASYSAAAAAAFCLFHPWMFFEPGKPKGSSCLQSGDLKRPRLKLEAQVAFS